MNKHPLGPQVLAEDVASYGGASNGRTRGFASMDPQRQREIASLGGQAAHIKGTAHQFTSEEAREAGRKGGRTRAENLRRLQAAQQAQIQRT